MGCLQPCWRWNRVLCSGLQDKLCSIYQSVDLTYKERVDGFDWRICKIWDSKIIFLRCDAVVWRIETKVSGEISASVFKVLPWKCEYNIPMRPFYLVTKMHGFTSLKTLRIIFTTARTLNYMCVIVYQIKIVVIHFITLHEGTERE